MLAVSAPVDCVPLAAFEPLQPPEAVHDVALVELQVNIELLPLAIDVGLAVSVAVGARAVVTVTVAVAGALVPPGPVQVIEYVVVAVSAPLVCVPLAAFVPVQPPEAVHDVAFVEFQVKVAVSPLLTAAGDARSDAVGGCATGAMGADPEPPQAANVSATPVANTVLKNRMGYLFTSSLRYSLLVLASAGRGARRIFTASGRCLKKHPLHNRAFNPDNREHR